MFEFAGLISESIQSILITIDATFFRFVGWLYEVYLLIASARIVQQDAIESLVKRLMVVVGIVTLFIIAFSLIKSLVDPEKEIKNTSKIFVNIITSIIMLTLVNTVFNYLYEFQNVLLKNNVIGKIIIGGVENFDINSAGTNMAADTFAAFFTDDPYMTSSDGIENDSRCKDEEGNIINDVTEDTECYYTADEKWYGKDTNWVSIKSVAENAKNSGNLTVAFLDLSKPVDNKAVDFSFFLALLCAIFMVYVFVSFCLDMAVRCAKLAVLQIISPIPILARIIPGQESIFNNWIKKTMTTFMEVFIRIAIIFFCIYLISSVSLKKNIFNYYILSGTSGPGVEGVAKIAVILGILMFAKQAPSFISQIFGVDSGNMKLGIKDKLASAALVGGVIDRKLNEAQGFVTGAAGGLMTGIRNKGIKTSDAIKSGASAGWRKGGNQYSNQRDRIFQKKYGYEAEQGLLGGLSLRQRLYDKHEKDAENSWKERSNQYVENYEKTDKFKEAFKNFDKKEAQQRMDAFRKTDFFKEAAGKAAVYWKNNKIDPNSKRGKEVLNEFIDQARANTTDTNLIRQIDTYRNDQKTMSLKYHSGVDLTFKGTKHTTLADGTVVNTADYQEWLDKTADNNAFLLHAKQSTEKYATGELTRNTDGSLDKIYDERYKVESDYISHGAKSKSDNQKLIDAIKGMNSK